MQIPLRTLSNVDAYIRNREWNDVRLPACPMHPTGGCSFARHGSYERLSLSGLRIARWYCPEGHRTFSLHVGSSFLPCFQAFHGKAVTKRMQAGPSFSFGGANVQPP
jgi:hypothetical protein